MSAIRRGKIYSRERVNLGEVVPLEAPFAIQIDICSACNLRCNFCFHSDIEAVKKSGIHFGLMSYEMFSKLIDDMGTVWGKGKIKKLRLFKVGEPLMNPHVCEMVKYAKKAEIAECIEITTNGLLLTDEMSQGLIEAGLDILNVSVNGINEKQYKDTCSVDINFNDFRENIKYFYDHRKSCQLFLKYSDIGYTEEEKEKFYHLFEDSCDEIFVETISGSLWQDTNISENVKSTGKGIYGQELEAKAVCPFLFTTMVINDQGIAHLCCVDWKSEYILGDLKNESVADIWNGEKLRLFQRLHLEKKKDTIELCKNCESLMGSTIDNIDEYAEDIMKRLF